MAAQDQALSLLASLIYAGFYLRVGEDGKLYIRPVSYFLNKAREQIQECKQYLMDWLINWYEPTATQLLDYVYSALATQYPAGALEWATKEMPELDRQWLDTLDAIDEAYKVMDMQAFVNALTDHCHVCKRIFAAYKKESEMTR